MSVYTILVKLLGQDAGASTAIKKVSAEAQGLQTTAKGLTGAMDMLAVGGFAFAGKAALDAVWGLGELGAKSLSLKASFQDLATQAGGSADQMLAAIRKGSAGTVSEMDMIAAANRGILLGLGANADQWEQLTEVARYRAKAMGISMTEALDNMAMGIGRESRLILDNLGIILDVDVATETYAKSLGKTADQLSAAERKQAILTAVITDGQAKIAAAGGLTDGYTSSLGRMDAALKDAKVSLGEAFAPAVAGVAEAVSQNIPAMQTTVSQMGMLKTATLAAATAFLTGGDAGNAFQTMMAMQIGAVDEAIRLQQELATQQYNTAESSAELVSAGLVLGASWDQIASKAATLGIAINAVDYAKYIAQTNAAAEETNRWSLSADAARAATEQVITPTNVWFDALSQTSGVVNNLAAGAGRATLAIGQLQGAFQTGKPAALEYAEGLYAVNNAINAVLQDAAKVSPEEIGQGFAGATSRLESSLVGLSGVAPSDTIRTLYDQYKAELQAVYQEAGDITDFELKMREEAVMNRLQSTVKQFDDAADGEKSAIDKMASQYATLRSAVESALQPTAVTAEDMGLAATGDYVEKWDENARRLDAIAERGFAELQQHADWAAALNIPPEVLASSEQALKAWANRTADAVRNLTRPDLIDIGAAADAVQKTLQDKAAKEITVDLVVAELVRRGGVSEEAARQQALQMYGLEEPLPVSMQLTDTAKADFITAVGTVAVPATLDLTTTEAAEAVPGEATGGLVGQTLPVSLSLVEGGMDAFLLAVGTIPLPVSFSVAGAGGEGEEADMTAVVQPVVAALVVGFNDALDEFSPALVLAERIVVDVSEQAKVLRDAGGTIWDGVEKGLIDGIKEGDYADEFARVLVPVILKAIKAWGEYT